MSSRDMVSIFGRPVPLKLSWETVGLPIAFLGLLVIFSIFSPQFLSVSNITNVLRQVAPLALLAFAQTIVIISAGIDLSQGSIVGLVSVVTAMVLLATNMWVGILAGLLAGLLIGLFNGVLTAKTKIPPFIVTLGMLSVARGAALTLTGGLPIFNLEADKFFFLGSGYIFHIPVPVYFAVIGFGLTYVILQLTPLGRYCYAIGGNEETVRLAGINVAKYKILIYTLSGLFSGIAGVLLTARVISGQPLLGTGYELQAVAAVVIGGTSLFGGVGRIGGTILGVLFVGILNNGLNLLGVSTFVQQIVIGFTIIVAVWLSGSKTN